MPLDRRTINSHKIKTCGCLACTEERERLQISPPRRISLPPSAAHLFRLIPSRNPFGSLARELNSK